MTTRCDTQRADSHFSIPAHNRPSRNGLDVNTFGAGSSSLPASDYSSRLTPTGLIHLDKYRSEESRTPDSLWRISCQVCRVDLEIGDRRHGCSRTSEAITRWPWCAGARRCQRRSCSLRCACSTLTSPTRSARAAWIEQRPSAPLSSPASGLWSCLPTSWGAGSLTCSGAVLDDRLVGEVASVTAACLAWLVQCGLVEGPSPPLRSWCYGAAPVPGVGRSSARR